ncbi:MAG: response regulator [Bacteroides sp.]|jgi:two-component system CheB/CheR fusion protein|nr:response regulator [Bacteroides sp.]
MDIDEVESKSKELKILLVDDDKRQLHALEKLISKLNLDILKAYSGQEALALMLHNQFMMVVLDMVMPDMSGMEVARLMRGFKNTQNTPIIFATAFSKDEVQMTSAYQLGAIDYIIKPINEDILLSKIKVFRDFHLFEKRKQDETLKLLSELQDKNKILEETRIAALDMLEEANEARNQALKAQHELERSLNKQKAIERKLKVAIKKAENANIYKNNFLANMSHEIRTPMNAIVGFADLMKDCALSPEERNMYAEIINTNSLQLLRLIGDIIDVAKIEAGEMKITMDRCYLHQLLRELEVQFNQLRQARGKDNVSLVLDIPDDVPFSCIKTDSFRLNQVLINLLNNALKFSEEGEIRFGYEIHDSVLLFFVQDQGIGIKKEMLNLIFERFQQALPDDSAKYGGTGLGLAICKGIVNLLGGRMFVESEPGEGSKFSFTLPLKVVDEVCEEYLDELSAADVADIEGKTLLIADDNLSVQEYFIEALKPYHLQLIMANSGREVVDLYKKHPEIDLVLMDIRMPLMDGYGAIKEILQYNPEAIIIAQTGNVLQDDEKKCLEAGCKGFLSKPILKNDLVKTIRKHC